MGLDMYLSARVYAGKPWGEKVDPKRTALEVAAAKVGLGASDNIDYITIERECAYWRKANQVHNWFVRNVQDGKDDCGNYYVGREQLQKLRDTCQQVIDGSTLVEGKVTNGYTYDAGGEKPILEDGEFIKDGALAEQLLPTGEGFFFGSTDYDQWYIADLKSTVKQIDKALTLPEDVEFYYHSSW